MQPSVFSSVDFVEYFKYYMHCTLFSALCWFPSSLCASWLVGLLCVFTLVGQPLAGAELVVCASPLSCGGFHTRATPPGRHPPTSCPVIVFLGGWDRFAPPVLNWRCCRSCCRYLWAAVPWKHPCNAGGGLGFKPETGLGFEPETGLDFWPKTRLDFWPKTRLGFWPKTGLGFFKNGISNSGL